MKKNSKFRFVEYFIVLVLAAGLGFSGGYLAVRNPGGILKISNSSESSEQKMKAQTFAVEESNYITAIEKVSPSVVSIVATKDVEVFLTQPFSFFGPFGNDPFFGQQAPNIPERESEKVTKKIGGGTGFIVSEDGLVLTNKHVVADEDADYTVFINNETKYYAKLVSKDPSNDIAMIQLYKDENRENKVQGLTAVDLGDSEQTPIGSHLLAIGNALGEFQNTSTAGILSARDRSITAGDSNGQNASALNNLLQTDAAINPGNSGGPLVNLQGEVIGINTAVAQQANGIGFAIPINEVKSVIESVKEFGEIIRPFVGIRYSMISDDIAKELGLGEKGGAYLANDIQHGVAAVVKDSPADKAGLKANDLILKINEEEINEGNTLVQSLNKFKPEDKVKFLVLRDGEKIELEVTLEKFQDGQTIESEE